jgi:allantoate deiminase
MIDGGRVRRRLEALAEIGRDSEGGISRFSFSEEDRQARGLFVSWCRQAGLEPRVDPVGNLVARYEGIQAALPALAAGSHLDTVPRGGALDGALGCVASLECAQSLAERGRRLAHPLEVLVFAEEEGSRFGSGLLGSRAMAGKLRAEELEELKDREGSSAREVMERFGLRPRALEEAARRPGELAAYLELHIEQGEVLERESLPIGIVSGIAGIWRYTLRFLGQANHAGTTALPARRDALLAAARFIVAARDVALRRGEPGSVATVGRIAVRPGAINVVPGEAELSLEVRAAAAPGLEAVAARILEEGQRIAAAERVELQVQPGPRIAPVPLDPGVRRAVQRACRSLGIASLQLPSGAGHDAQSMAGLCPAGMIFVPSAGGISHAPGEFTPWEQVAAGVRVLAKSLEILDQGEGSHEG